MSSAGSGPKWLDLARHIEALGYSTLTMPDHFDAQFAPVPALTAAAMATTHLRVGALVWDNDYKHPLVLAKELATLDVLSQGRLEIGLGAGWMRTDYDQAGIVYDTPKVRVDRFEEGLDVICGLLSPGPFSYRGVHYTITEHTAHPHPVQQPRPPLLIGGGGPRVLTIAAKRAEIVGINPSLHTGAIGSAVIGDMTAEQVDAKVEIVRTAAGDRYGDIELNIRCFMVDVTNDRATSVAGVAGFTGMTEAQVTESPFALIGSVAQIIEDLERSRERWGFSYVIVGAESLDAMAPVVAALTGR